MQTDTSEVLFRMKRQEAINAESRIADASVIVRTIQEEAWRARRALGIPAQRWPADAVVVCCRWAYPRFGFHVGDVTLMWQAEPDLWLGYSIRLAGNVVVKHEYEFEIMHWRGCPCIDCLPQRYRIEFNEAQLAILRRWRDLGGPVGR